MKDLILGTAIFSPGYGISNSKRRLSDEEGTDLIHSALNLGIRSFDTAPTYGRAEEILGNFKKSDQAFSISTKVSLESCKDPRKLRKSILESLEKLQISQIEILYLHNEKILLEHNPSALLNELERLRTDGIYRKLGVSIYTGEVLQILRRNFMEIDVFQVPENICDRRLRNSSWIQELCNDNREYIVRSVFLQGLLLMQEEKIPAYLLDAKAAIGKLNAFAKTNDISPLDLCLAYVRSLSWCNSILVGAANPTELSMIISSKRGLPNGWETEIPEIPNQLIDPRNWKI